MALGLCLSGDKSSLAQSDKMSHVLFLKLTGTSRTEKHILSEASYLTSLPVISVQERPVDFSSSKHLLL